MLPGLRIVNNVQNINHAQFTDDTLLLGGASTHSAEHFKQELEIYKEVSGSKINFQKSKIFSWKCSAREVQEITRMLGMEGTMDWESFIYLGIPICKTKINSANWDTILDKIKIKIQRWSANWINLAGKTILIKVVLNSMPIYHSSILLTPSLVIRKMEGLLKNLSVKGERGMKRSSI